MAACDRLVGSSIGDCDNLVVVVVSGCVFVCG